MASPLRFFLLFVVVGTLVVAGTISDMQFYSSSFLSGEVYLPSDRLDQGDDYKRFVASKDKQKLAISFFPYNEFNYERIRGTWRLHRFINHKDEARRINAFVDLQLVGNSRINCESNVAKNTDKMNEIIPWRICRHEFRISFIPKFEKVKFGKDRLALVRKTENGFEIFEAEKVIEKEVEIGPVAEEKSVAQKQPTKSDSAKKYSCIDTDKELLLERALFPKLSKHILTGELVQGSLSVSAGEIKRLEAELNAGPEKRLLLEFDYTRINDGCQFSTTAYYEGRRHDVSGIISKNGKDGFRVRIATAPFAGLMLNYMTEEAYEEYRRQKEMAELARNENESRTSAVERMVQRRIAEQERLQKEENVDQKDEYQDEYQQESEPAGEDDNQITEDEMAMKVKKSGFNFSQHSQIKRRELASMEDFYQMESDEKNKKESK